MVFTDNKKEGPTLKPTPENEAHVKAEILLLWLPKLRFETDVSECVWPPLQGQGRP
jgi:hypothetical protein